MRVALCQLNLRVGDVGGNADRVIATVAGLADDVDVAVFPELSIAGYPPEDLVLKDRFVADNLEQLERIAAATTRTAVVVGVVDRDGDALFNAAAVCAGGRVCGVYRKRELPNYAVFDEQRYFERGPAELPLFEIAGVPVGVSVCEDAWTATGPIPELAAGGARVILNINGSPFHRGKQQLREDEVIGGLGRQTGCPIVYVNLVGGQDELVFDGGSFVLDAEGEVAARSPHFVEDVVVVDVEPAPPRPVALSLTAVTPADDVPKPPLAEAPVAPPLTDHENVWRALVLGTRDYIHKNGFDGVVVGLSGGVDSTIVAALATDALGAENVHGVLMPSRFSSDHSVADAVALSENLGIDHRIVPIEPGHAALLEMLEDSFAGTEAGLTEENIQSRLRGVVLMALSNKFGWMVLTTGNKSETSVGYSTLYGDTAGGYAVIKDVPKLLVYELCRHRNEKHAVDHPGEELIPENILTKPPSAELRPDQRDDQSLPPYEVLDPILEAYVEHDQTAADLEAAGHDGELVRRIITLVDRAEYKRRQSPPGPRVTHKAFGKDRRLPITNGYRS